MFRTGRERHERNRPSHHRLLRVLQGNPLDAAFTPEGAEYVEHFCGLECYRRFQARATVSAGHEAGQHSDDRQSDQGR